MSLTKEEKETLLAEVLLPSFTISKEIVRELLLLWWNCLPSGKAAHDGQQSSLQLQGESFHIDHTYKFVKCVGVTDQGQWVCIFCVTIVSYQ